MVYDGDIITPVLHFTKIYIWRCYSGRTTVWYTRTSECRISGGKQEFVGDLVVHVDRDLKLARNTNVYTQVRLRLVLPGYIGVCIIADVLSQTGTKCR